MTVAAGNEGGPSPLANRLWRLIQSSRRQAQADLEGGRGFLWLPVALGFGSAIYFLLPFEPPHMPLHVGAFIALAFWGQQRHRTGRNPPAAVLLAMTLAGLSAAALATDRAATPTLVAERTSRIVGTVVAVEDRAERGIRIRLKVEAMAPRPEGGLPHLLRLTLRGAPAPTPGSRIGLTARVGPPSPPLVPGGYDFARIAYFQGIGGTGFSLGTPTVLPAIGDPDLMEFFNLLVERLRTGASARIREVLAGDAGAIAAALIVGDRGAISTEADDAMRVAGLSHVLSISGLHMALVAACLYGGLRFLMAAIPPVALNLPIRTMAAFATLIGTLAYLVIAGMSLPTQRSAVMIAVSLIAIMLGRRALTMRGLAVAALIVLIFQPVAVVDPGAQMSFAAVAALIAAFEALAARAPQPIEADISPLMRGAATIRRWLTMAALSTLVAGLATTPIALHHFSQGAPFGLLANLAATPVISFVIMPAGLVAALGMPLGLDALPLAVMGAGIEAMLAIAAEVASWTPAGGLIGRPGLAGTLLVVAGGLWLCLWRPPLGLAGIPAILAGLALMPLATPPDLVIAGDGRRALYAAPNGTIHLLGRADDFETRLWLEQRGDPRQPTDPDLARNRRCDPEACIIDAPGLSAAVVYRPIAFADECGAVDLLITPLDAPIWCTARIAILDRTTLERTGARSYRIDRQDRSTPVLDLLATAVPPVRRPWHPPAPVTDRAD